MSFPLAETQNNQLSMHSFTKNEAMHDIVHFLQFRATFSFIFYEFCCVYNKNIKIFILF